ncbi:hypothetical protein OIE68_12745 [Nocardia vinacea]|uniref:hypothetical protein n=1 Tax=Nocardia vinacea TaxID=96468 RepID=UPI002E0FBA21|nr:hypothetical protein OIE68_12745 [Nocardia vinacea]
MCDEIAWGNIGFGVRGDVPDAEVPGVVSSRGESLSIPRVRAVLTSRAASGARWRSSNATSRAASTPAPLLAACGGLGEAAEHGLLEIGKLAQHRAVHGARLTAEGHEFVVDGAA